MNDLYLVKATPKWSGQVYYIVMTKESYEKLYENNELSYELLLTGNFVFDENVLYTQMKDMLEEWYNR